MPTSRCKCGAKYRYPESSIGKRAKCKKCGTIFTLKPEDDEGPIPIADDSDMRGEIAAAAARARNATTPTQGEVFVPPGSPGAVSSPGLGAPAAGAGAASSKSYGADVLWTFLFPSSPGNLITFLVIWGAMVIAPLLFCVPCFGLILGFLVVAWYAAFRFEVLASAAAGESDLPEIVFSRTFIYDLIEPLFKWIGTWIVVFIPAMLYLLLERPAGGMTGASLVGMMMGGLAGVLQGSSSGMVVFDALVFLGIFFWPMVILCVALGGFATLYRLDLIVWTIIKTFPVYLVTLVLMFGAVFVQQALLQAAGGGIALQAQQGQASLGGMMGGALILHILGTGLDVYLSIVLMRLIGLYYHHFKERFAWSWG